MILNGRELNNGKRRRAGKGPRSVLEATRAVHRAPTSILCGCGRRISLGRLKCWRCAVKGAVGVEN